MNVLRNVIKLVAVGVIIVIILVILESQGIYDFGFGQYPKDKKPDDTELPDDDTELPDDDEPIIPITPSPDDNTPVVPIPPTDGELPDDDEPVIPVPTPGSGYYDENGEWVLKENTGCVTHSTYDGTSNNRIRAEWVNSDGKKKEHVYYVGAFRNTETSPFPTASTVDFVFVNQPTLYLFSGRDFTGQCATYNYDKYNKKVTVPNSQFGFIPKSIIVDNKNAVMRTKSDACQELFNNPNFKCEQH